MFCCVFCFQFPAQLTLCVFFKLASDCADAAHNKQQVDLEHQKQSQLREFEIADNKQRHQALVSFRLKP